MALGYPFDATQRFNTVYNITQDMSNWDSAVIQVVGPMSGRINLQGSNDGGGPPGMSSGDAQLAINFSPIQAKDLSTGTMVNAIYGAGLFEVEFGAQYLRLQGSPAATPTSVYRLMMFNSKIS